MQEIVVFNEVEASLAHYEHENNNLVFDYEDNKGNKEARSHVAKLRKVKTHIATVHKEAKAKALAFGRALDGKKNDLSDRVDKMIGVHNEPIQRIKDRKDAENRRVAEEFAAKKLAEEEARQAEIDAKEAELVQREAELKAHEAKMNAQLAEIEKAERDREIAENAKKEAEAEAERKLQQAEQKRLADIESEKQRARDEAETKERIWQERKEAEEAENTRLAEIERKRVENVKHRANIEGTIRHMLNSYTNKNTVSEAILEAIKNKTIPNLIINY